MPTNSQVSAIVAGQSSGNAGFAQQPNNKFNPYLNQVQQQQQTSVRESLGGDVANA
jgi:hypothetical protein